MMTAVSDRPLPAHGPHRLQRASNGAADAAPPAAQPRAVEGDGAPRAHIEAMLAVTRRYFEAPLQTPPPPAPKAPRG